ncbi:hypothetical protein C6501_17050 [Candidatus Poribacteria bacterium]|nr:MAG: hypothetical protein C6501_17050 [Candidatus Poribacteria bacterium]
MNIVLRSPYNSLKMKNVFLFSILFCVITLPAFGQLTDTDLNKIRLIIQEEIKKESSTTNKKIDALDSRMRNVEQDIAWIKGKLESVDKQFDGVDKQFASIGDQFGSVRAQITHVTYLTYGLIALIVAAVAIPQILIARRSERDRALERQVEMLTKEIETLKQQRIVNP